MRTGRERRQNLIRFRNLVDDAEKFLADEPDAAQAKKLLTALQRLRDDPEHPTWEHPGEGLAVLATHEDVHVFALAVPVEEQVHVGERYYLKPLLRIVQEEGHYFAAAVSQKSVRVFEGTSVSIRERHPAHLPRDLKDALNIDEYMSSLQYHSLPRGGNSDVIYHGQGSGEDDRKKDLLQYFHRLDTALASFLNGQDAPLVFAGVEYLFPIFKEAVSYPNLLPQPVEGNFDEASTEQLHDRIWPVVQPYFQHQIDAVVANYQDACKQDRACHRPEQVLRAAARGAIETLLLRRGASCWGQLDTEGNIEHHENPGETSLDLLDEASYETLHNSGRVLVLEDSRFPEPDVPCVAVLRYPVQAATAG